MNPQYIVYIGICTVALGIFFSDWNPLKPEFEMNVVELDFFIDNKSFYLDCTSDNYSCKYEIINGVGYWFVSENGEDWYKVLSHNSDGVRK